MTQFETYSLILGVVQAVAIVISLVALWWQLRQFNENMKCDAYARHVEDYSRVSELLIEHPELARIYHQGQGEVDDLNDEDKKFYNFVALVIGYYERLFNLHRRGWIDDKTWASWEVWLVESGSRWRCFTGIGETKVSGSILILTTSSRESTTNTA